MSGTPGHSGGHNKLSAAAQRLRSGPNARKQAQQIADWHALLDALETAKAPEGWDPLEAYCRQVLDEGLPAGKYHRLACARHRRDWARRGTVDFPYIVDFDNIWRFLVFARHLAHYEGEWAGNPIAFQPWQVFRLGSLFGWVHHETGLRRFRTSYTEVPRKNGKSLEAAVVALYVTFFDGEPGAQGVCAATKRKQAEIVFNNARVLAVKSGLKIGLLCLIRVVMREDTDSKLEAISSDSQTMDGLNPHLVIIDEFHAHTDRGLIDVLESGLGARRQPVNFQITTAGDNPVSPCGDQHDYAVRVLEGVIEDETTFAFIAHADLEDDWTLIETAQKANPNYGVSVRPDVLLSDLAQAKALPAKAAEYQQKKLNLWVNKSTPWLLMDGWRRGQSTWALEDLAHEPCWIGVDLASKLDLCALVALFPPTAGRSSYRLVRRVWTAQDTLMDRAHRDKAPYDRWVASGALIAVRGESVHYDVVRQALVELRGRVDIERIGFDPYHADQIMDELKREDGFAEDQVITVPQTNAGLSGGTKAFEVAVAEGRMDAGDCPVMAWCAANAVVMADTNGNIRPVKNRSVGRIDPITAAVIAMSAYLRTAAPQTSIYASRPALIF